MLVGWVGTTHSLNGAPVKRSGRKYCLAVIKFADLGCWWAKLLASTALLKKTMCNSKKYPYSLHRRDWNFLGGGGKEDFVWPKNLKKCMKLNWSFQRGGGPLRNPFCGGIHRNLKKKRVITADYQSKGFASIML